MHLLQAVLMGIIQGLSEFLPISSSAHLVFTSNLYKVAKNIDTMQIPEQEIFLDIMLHLGTLIAVLIFFRKDVFKICKAFLLGLKNKDFDNPDFKTGLYIIVGTILTICVAYPLCNISERLVFMPALVGVLLVITGCILLFSEWISKKQNVNKEIRLASAILTGLAQGLASLPGFSRSGLTIAAALLTGSNRITAAKYSFLLSIPIILGASMIYPLAKINIADILTFNWFAILAGTFVSGLVGYFCIKYFLKFVEKFSMAFFGYYCIIVGLFACLFFINKI